jgi:hypothetical protein
MASLTTAEKIREEASSKVYGDLKTDELQKELAKSVLVEEERYNIDEMKKRAITKARSYDEFRQMVLCANLKPMKSKELAALGASNPKDRAFTHNSVASTSAEITTGRFRRRTGEILLGSATTTNTTTDKLSTSSNKTTPTTNICTPELTPLNSITERARRKAREIPKPVGPGLSTKRRKPKNRSEFQRDWQRSCKTVEKQQEYMRSVGIKRMKKIFASGLPSGMLGSLLETLHAMCSEENFSPTDLFVVNVLTVLKSAPGFAMETMFLSKGERATVQETLSIVSADKELISAFTF